MGAFEDAEKASATGVFNSEQQRARFAMTVVLQSAVRGGERVIIDVL